MKISDVRKPLAIYDVKEKGWFRAFLDTVHISELRSFDANFPATDQELKPKELHDLAKIIFTLKSWDPSLASVRAFIAIAAELGGHEAINHLGNTGFLTEENVTLLEKYKDHGLNIARFIVLTSFSYTADEMAEQLKILNLKNIERILEDIEELHKDEMLTKASLNLILKAEDYHAKKKILYLLEKNCWFNSININKLAGEDSVNIVISINKLNQLNLNALHFKAILSKIFSESSHCRSLINGVEKLGAIVHNSDLKILLNAPQHATRLAMAIEIFNRAPVAHYKIKEIIFSIPEYADELALAIQNIVKNKELDDKDRLILVVVLQEMHKYELIEKNNPKSVANLIRLNHKELISMNFIDLATVLGSANLFNQNNFENIIGYFCFEGFIEELAKGCGHLGQNNTLNQDSLNELLIDTTNRFRQEHERLRRIRIQERADRIIDYLNKLPSEELDQESEPFSEINLPLNVVETKSIREQNRMFFSGDKDNNKSSSDIDFSDDDSTYRIL